MKIFVVGNQKTGTTSICSALEILGFRTSHWIHHEEITPMIREGRYDFPMLETHDAVGDLPIPSIYKELDEHYPGSRFILTVRDTDDWIESLENRRWWKDREPPIELAEEEQMFYGISHYDREKCIAAYERHNREVRAHFRDRPEQLLDFVLGDHGWEELCSFLDRPIPRDPFPYKNRRVYPPESAFSRLLKAGLGKVGLRAPLRAFRDRFLRGAS